MPLNITDPFGTLSTFQPETEFGSRKLSVTIATNVEERLIPKSTSCEKGFFFKPAVTSESPSVDMEDDKEEFRTLLCEVSRTLSTSLSLPFENLRRGVP